MEVMRLASAIDKQQVLDQMDKLESNLVSMKDQLEKDKEKLGDPDLIDKLNKSRNFFTELIIDKIEKDVNNKKLIEKNNNSINIIEDYIKDIKNIKEKISNQTEDSCNSEHLKSMFSSLNEANSVISPLCKSESRSTNGIQNAGTTLSFGGKVLLGLGAASLFFCPFATLPLLFAGGISTLSGWATKKVGNVIESVKNKTNKIFKWDKKS